MKKAIRQAMAAAMAVCLLLALTACGEKKETVENNSPAATWQEQYDLGMRYLSEGSYEEAILAFTAAIEIDPKQADLYIGRAQAYILSGETQENLATAQADFELAIGLDETKADAWLGLADTYIRMGNMEKALEVLKDGLSKTGSDSAIADKIAQMESGNITDSAGNMRRRSSYDGSGALLWYHTYSYNANGDEASATSFNAAGQQTGHVEMEYDAQGNQTVGHYWINDNGRIGRIEFEYDTAGNNTKAVWYMSDSEGNVSAETYLYTYDSSGNCIKEEYYSEEGWLDFVTEYEYDAAGQMVKTSVYDAEGRLYNYDLYEYNAEGNISTVLSYFDFDGEMKLEHKLVYLYNEQGENIGYEEYDGDGNLLQSTLLE